MARWCAGSASAARGHRPCRYDKVTTAFYKLLRSGSKEDAHAAAADMKSELSWLEVGCGTDAMRPCGRVTYGVEHGRLLVKRVGSCHVVGV